MVDDRINPLKRPLLDGIVPEREVTRNENHWVLVMLTMLAVMMAVIVVTGVTHSLSPPSNVETVDPTTLHLGGAPRSSPTGRSPLVGGSMIWVALMIYNMVAWKRDNPGRPVPLAMFAITATALLWAWAASGVVVEFLGVILPRAVGRHRSMWALRGRCSP